MAKIREGFHECPKCGQELFTINFVIFGYPPEEIMASSCSNTKCSLYCKKDCTLWNKYCYCYPGNEINMLTGKDPNGLKYSFLEE